MPLPLIERVGNLEDRLIKLEGLLKGAVVRVDVIEAAAIAAGVQKEKIKAQMQKARSARRKA